MYIIWILALLVIAVMIWIDNLKDLANKKHPSYVRQIDLDKWSKK